jgi:surface protein
MKNLDQYISESLKGYKLGAIKPKEQLPENCKEYFSNKKVNVDEIENLDTSKVTNMCNMFECAKFNSDSLDLSGWDVSNVTNMDSMFSYIDDLKSLDLSDWNVSNVTDMCYMFGNCKNLEYIDVSNWHATNLRKIHQLFMFCDKLKTIDGISDWDVSKIIRLDGIFRYCSSLESLDLSKWDLSKVCITKYLFDYCENLTDIKFGPGWGTWDSHFVGFSICDCGRKKGYELSDETYESMLTMYDRKKAGLKPIFVYLNIKHNIPYSYQNDWRKKMEERGYVIKQITSSEAIN